MICSKNQQKNLQMQSTAQERTETRLYHCCKCIRSPWKRRNFYLSIKNVVSNAITCQTAVILYNTKSTYGRHQKSPKMLQPMFCIVRCQSMAVVVQYQWQSSSTQKCKKKIKTKTEKTDKIRQWLLVSLFAKTNFIFRCELFKDSREKYPRCFSTLRDVCRKF